MGRAWVDPDALRPSNSKKREQIMTMFEQRSAKLRKRQRQLNCVNCLLLFAVIGLFIMAVISVFKANGAYAAGYGLLCCAAAWLFMRTPARVGW